MAGAAMDLDLDSRGDPKIQYDTSNDCFKSIAVDIEIWEVQNTGPRPIGCL